HRVGRGQRGAGVDVVLTRGQGRLRAAFGHRGDGLDAHAGHLARVLHGVRGDRAAFDLSVDVLATTVDGDHQDVGLARGLHRLQCAVGRRFVDGVDHVDVTVGGQAVLHRGLAAWDGALGGLVAGDGVVTTLAAGVV